MNLLQLFGLLGIALGLGLACYYAIEFYVKCVEKMHVKLDKLIDEENKDV